MKVTCIWLGIAPLACEMKSRRPAELQKRPQRLTNELELHFSRGVICGRSRWRSPGAIRANCEASTDNSAIGVESGTAGFDARRPAGRTQFCRFYPRARAASSEISGFADEGA